MIQLIGLLGCLYLFVKGLEIVSSAAFRNQREALKGTAAVAAVLALIGSVGFSLLFIVQGIDWPATNSQPEYSSRSAAMPGPSKSDEDFRNCLNDMNTTSC